MEKFSFLKTIGSFRPSPRVTKWRRREWERLDSESDTRSHLRRVTVSWVDDPLSFVVEGNTYIATQRFLVSPQLAVSMMNLPRELIHLCSQFPKSIAKEDGTLATVIHVKSPVITYDWLLQLINEWFARDDVFVRPFLSEVIFLQADVSEIVIEDAARGLFRDWGCRCITFFRAEFVPPPAPGPYLIEASSLWQARRVYDDSNDTLLTALLPDAQRLVPQPYHITD